MKGNCRCGRPLKVTHDTDTGIARISCAEPNCRLALDFNSRRKDFPQRPAFMGGKRA